jgi:hypothetical protein
VPGILSSRIGHLNGNEIVEVEYDSTQTDLAQLVSALKQESSFYAVIIKDKKDLSEAIRQIDPSEVKQIPTDPYYIESKYSLKTRYPDLYYLDLTEQQASALNSWSYFGGKMPDVLTAEQEARWQQLKFKLRNKKPDRLQPLRSGPGLEKYRQQLMDWIDN